MYTKNVMLNKKVIAKISDDRMNRLWAGKNAVNIICSGADGCGSGGTGGTGGGSTEFDINKCPNYSGVGSGCPSETCGYAYTCNGK